MALSFRLVSTPIATPSSHPSFPVRLLTFIWAHSFADYVPDLLKEQVHSLESASSLYVNEHSAYAARLSCGGAIEICDAIASGRIRNGFAIVRPPGHHAEPHKSMGFCFFNNVAVATRVLQQKYPNTMRKILILDWDVHHGNGTQRAFEDDPNVLYISIHRYDEDGSFYPGSTYGNYDSCGTGPGEGKSVNIPWPSLGMGDADYMYAFRQLVMPIANEFDPDLVIVSAGFDAAVGDPIGQNRVTPAGFAQMAHALTSLCDGKVAVVLEGGYNPEAVADSALEVTKALLHHEIDVPDEIEVSTIAAKTVDRCCAHQRRYWKSVRARAADIIDVDAESASSSVSTQIGVLLAAYRHNRLAQEYQLFQMPTEDTPLSKFKGQVLCSERILDSFSTIVFFVHDMGNIRSDLYRIQPHLEEEARQLVDTSGKVLDYARSKGFGIIDMNIFSELVALKPVVAQGVRKPGVPTNMDQDQFSEICKTAVFIWDNIVRLAGTSREDLRVVLVGYGSGCNVLTSLIEERKVTEYVPAVVNVMGYGTMPCLPATANLSDKQWYYKNSRVFMPADHRHLVEQGDSAPLKRFGRIQAVGKYLFLTPTSVDGFKLTMSLTICNSTKNRGCTGDQHPEQEHG